MCHKNEIRTKVSSLKSCNFSKFYPNLLKLSTSRDFYKSDALAQTNQAKYDSFFSHGTEIILQWKNSEKKKKFSQDGDFSKPRIFRF